MLRLVCLTLLLVAMAAFAGGTTDSLKVDLDDVVEQGKVSPVGGMTSSGQPDKAALSVFADSGYVAVIDMRTPGENRGLDEPETVKELGMEYVSFPIGKNDLTLEKAGELDVLLEQFDGPVLLHCGSANRVGAMLALREFRDSGDAEKAMQLGKEGGLKSLEGAVEEVLESN